MVEGADCQFHEQLIRRFVARSGLGFDAIPLRFGYPNGLRQCLGHEVFHFSGTDSGSIVPEGT